MLINQTECAWAKHRQEPGRYRGRALYDTSGTSSQQAKCHVPLRYLPLGRMRSLSLTGSDGWGQLAVADADKDHACLQRPKGDKRRPLALCKGHGMHTLKTKKLDWCTDQPVTAPCHQPGTLTGYREKSMASTAESHFFVAFLSFFFVLRRFSMCWSLRSILHISYVCTRTLHKTTRFPHKTIRVWTKRKTGEHKYQSGNRLVQALEVQMAMWSDMGYGYSARPGPCRIAAYLPVLWSVPRPSR